MRKIAFKGFIILAAAVALCIFFSRTILTITTAKVQRISAVRGKLEERITLPGKVFFDKTEEVVAEGARKLALVIDKVHVRAGAKVLAGDVIYSASAPAYQEELDKLAEEYTKKSGELAAKVASRIVYAQASAHNEKYQEYLRATEDMYADVYAALREARALGKTLPAEYGAWADVQNKSELLLAAVDAIAHKTEVEREYRKFYNQGGGRVADSTFEHIKECDALRGEIADIQEKMLALDTLASALTQIKAPHDGYIVALSLKEGDEYDGKKNAFTISAAESVPVLRLDVTNVDKELAEGTKAQVENGDEEGTIAEVTIASDGKKYASVTVDAAFIKAAGGLSGMLAEDTVVVVKYKAKKTSTLLPASAVRSGGEKDDYIFVISKSYGGLLSGEGMSVRKQAVTVLEKSDKMVSVAEDLSYLEIADREDRTLSDELAVMDYAQ